jgi:hypothetical protein
VLLKVYYKSFLPTQVIGKEKPSLCMNCVDPEFVAEKAIDYINSLNIE